MTGKINTTRPTSDGPAVRHAVDGSRPESTEEGRAAPTDEKAVAPADAESESTVCAAYWAY